MSQFPPSNSTFTQQPPPTHHIHNPSDPLPGSKGAAAPAAPDYSADVTNDPRVWQDRNQRGTDTGAVVAGGQHAASPSPMGSSTGVGAGGVGAGGAGAGGYGNNPQGSRTAYDEERPMGVQPAEGGGVAVGQGAADANLPEGKAKVTDRIIGKTQKVAGKVTGNAAMHEKGELREAGGKLAAQGQARAPHD
ncbi:hypothetical protein OH77DRAFT_1498671 [Trametes cingulata]|nr:hypothetical protein OH77DRAFT_1498671 [Trametes cingulata]